eukprot:3940694-Rhodomonas_salina.3
MEPDHDEIGSEGPQPARRAPWYATCATSSPWITRSRMAFAVPFSSGPATAHLASASPTLASASPTLASASPTLASS